MEALIVLLVLYWAAGETYEHVKGGWKKSRKAYMKRAAKKNPKQSKGRQFLSALRHDLGYAAAQLRHGFPVARHGFAQGWHEARKAQAGAAAAREKAKTEHAEGLAGLIEQIREYRKRQAEAAERIRRQYAEEHPEGSGEGTPGGSTSPDPATVVKGSAEDVPTPDEPPSPERYLLTVRSKSGRILDPFTQSPVTTISVWSREDLERRLAAASDDPDLEVSHRPMPDADVEDGQIGAWGVNPQAGADVRLADSYADEARAIRHNFEFQYCETCGKDLDRHTIGPDALGHAHAWCDDDEDGPGPDAYRPGEPPQQDQARQPVNPHNTGGTQMADTTYDGIVREMETAVSDAENRTAEASTAQAAAEANAAQVAAAKTQAHLSADEMQALEMDAATLGAMADYLEVLDRAETAHRDAEEASARARAENVRVQEAALNVAATMKRGHAALAAAHQEAPVDAADKAFYQG